MHLHLSLPDGFAPSSSGSVAAVLSPAPLSATATESTDEGDDDDAGGSTIISFLPLILIFAAVYFLLLRPRQRQMRRQRELQSSLEVGDEILMTSGVYGFITGIEPGSDIVWVEIDDDVQIRVSRAAVSGKVDTTATAESAGDSGSGAEGAPSGGASRPTLKGGGRSSAQRSGDQAESSELPDE
jgi:preprotein translocase subunit YajC